MAVRLPSRAWGLDDAKRSAVGRDRCTLPYCQASASRPGMPGRRQRSRPARLFAGRTGGRAVPERASRPGVARAGETMTTPPAAAPAAAPSAAAAPVPAAGQPAPGPAVPGSPPPR